MGMTVAEKILARKSGNQSVEAGRIVEVTPDIVMTHYATYRTIGVLEKLGAGGPLHKEQIRIVLDHRSPPKTAVHADHEKIARDYAKKYDLTLYDVHEGIAHVVLLQHQEIKPGMVVVGTDSHSTIYGCIGAFGTGIGFTEAASVWITGKLWMKVPETIKIVLQGRNLPPGTTPKDLILSIVGDVTANGCTYKSVEFAGEFIEHLTLPGRMTLSCLSMEMGVKAAMFPVDELSSVFSGEESGAPSSSLRADSDAVYEKTLTYDVEKLEPMISVPHNVDQVSPVSKLDAVRINQAFVGSCSNGMPEDLALVAKVLKGRTVHPDVRFIVTPASRRVLQEIIGNGVAAQIIESGAILTNPGCSVCAEDGGSLGDGEVAISSSTRNFLGRMGSAKASVYLGSPAAVAASAVAGHIADPREYF